MLRRIAQRRAVHEREVVQLSVDRRVDAEDRDRRREGIAGGEVRTEIGPLLEGGRRHRDARRPGDGRDRLGRQAGLAEGGDAQVGAADEIVDGAPDRRLDAGVRGQAGEQDGDPEGDPEDAQRRAQGTSAQASDGEPVEGHGAAYRPSLASRAMSGVASCDSRRPSSIVSRMRPSPMTRTRSA